MKRILIIEDDQTLQKVYRAVLAKEGYHVDVASDGMEGLRKAQAEPPDLIVLDMLMPNMTGIEFLRAFDVVNKHPQVKVIAFSNSDQPERVQDALALGARKYMTKYSFSPKAMVGLIKDTLAEG